MDKDTEHGTEEPQPVGYPELESSEAKAEPPLGEPDKSSEPDFHRPTLLFRIIAAVMVIVFGTFVIGGLLRLVGGPDLSFLSRSHELAEAPGVSNWRKAVVQIEAYPQPGEQTRLGTGFNILSTGLVVTNRHVVEGVDTLSVTFRDDGPQRVKNVVLHPTMDLAVVELEGNDLPTVELANESPPTGRGIIVIGNPLGFPGIVAEGEIVAYRRHSGASTSIMELLAPIHPGSSGSPVFESGQVVAVVYAVLQGQESGTDRHALAIPVRYLDAIIPR